MGIVTYSLFSYFATAVIAYAVIGVVVGLSRFLSNNDAE